METVHSDSAFSSFRIWLQKEFTDRCRKNSRYSLRAFSKLLQMEPSSVSQILAGKRVASRKVVSHICSRMSVSPSQEQAFDLEIQTRKRASAPAASLTQNYFQLSEDAFAVIADWYHYAILELTFTTHFNSSPKSIAKKLGISATEAALAIERLKRLELLDDANGVLKKTDAQLTNGASGSTSSALRELQRQLLKKALDAVDMCEPENKDITSMTMAIDPKKLPEARIKIKNFRRDLCQFLEDGGSRTSVFNLGVQLYPLTNFEK